MITTIIIFFTILLLECVLSFDNAAVLAIIVNRNLPVHQRKKALKYGMIGAYVFRGLSLFMVSWLINNPEIGLWFKIIGGLYLIYLGYKGLTPQKDSLEEGEVSWMEKLMKKIGIGPFLGTIITVEYVDLIFSLDNLVAVVSLSSNITLICVAVFIGMAFMRFVAGVFSKLIERFPTIEFSAMIVIILLGIKMLLSGIAPMFTFLYYVGYIMQEHWFDIIFSSLMMLVFFFPMMFNRKKEINSTVKSK